MVVHTTDGTFAGTLRWFADPASGVSAHYLVALDGRVVQFVGEADTAFHAGMAPVEGVPVLAGAAPNVCTIGIEFADEGCPHDIERPDAQYEAGAFLLAAISRRWGIPLDADHVIAHRRINPGKTCPGNLEVDHLVDLAAAFAGAPAGDDASAPRLVVMVPARNAAADLPGFFESVERFTDAVVALDDGSTDDTAALLEEHPLVSVLLRNPRRETYEGWDDAQNRARLLDAARALAPDWVLWLDADERIPADDGHALRDFLATDALPGLAYGMRCFRMIGDGEHYDQADLWVYRLFASRDGQALPDTRLHFVPVPAAIPRSMWMRTTIRIQHFASLTEDRRLARFAKYREADPDEVFQAGYDHLLREPRELLRFEPRAPELPVLLGAAEGDDEIDPGAPVLSAIVISRDDEARIERAVRSVVEQESEEPFEVIVVTSGADRTASIVRECFPGVRLVELDHPALPGEARNAGLRFARGEYVSFPGSHVELAPGSLAARIRAHDAAWTMVTGTTRNGTDTPSGWAAYFLDHASVLPGRPSEELLTPPAHCSYDRRALLAVGGFPPDVRAGEDTWVNHALFSRGYRAFRAADVPLVHHNRCTTPWRLARHHFSRGRAFTMFRRALRPGADPGTEVRSFLRGYPRRRLRALDANVARWGGGLVARYHRVRPLVVLGITAAATGSWWESLRPSRGRPAEEGAAAAVPVASAGRPLDPLREPLRVRRTDPPPFARHRALFVHIPKTAGSALVRVMEREYADAPPFRVYGDTDEQLARLRGMSRQEQLAVRAVVGHMAMGLERELPGPSAVLTVVRDPVERIISHYHYVRSHPDDPGHRRALAGVEGLDDYVRRSEFADIVNNGQTRLLGSLVGETAVPADAAVLERALKVTDRDDVVVGVQDRFDEFLLLACRAFGWGWPAYRPENVGLGRPSAAELPEPTVELIRERNQLDTILYERACARVARELAAVPALEEQLATLRLAGRWSG